MKVFTTNPTTDRNSFIYILALMLLTAVLGLFACNENAKPNATAIQSDEDGKPIQQEIVIRTHSDYDSIRNAEARDDSTEMAQALAENAAIGNAIVATYETPEVLSEEGEDAADDPAIWVNQKDPEKSLIIGTNKRAGLHVYNLQGKELQFVESGKVNNVDIRGGFEWKGKSYALVGGSNRTTQTVDIYLLDAETGKLSDAQLKIESKVDDVYGLCMSYNPQTNSFFVFVNGKDGQVEQYQILGDENTLSSLFVGGFQVASQPEGMVADDQNQLLYIGVEEDAIYKGQITSEGVKLEDLVQIEQSTREQNDNISYDIEGLSIYFGKEKNYLVASSQGNFSYAVWELSNTVSQKDTYLKSFVIWEKPGSGIDGVEETDGLDVVSVALGNDFPKGLLVVQDGFNYDNGKAVKQNFKFVSWEHIEALLK